MGNLIALIIGWFKPSYNPIATRRGRLSTFCLLYLTEGIPQGFVQIVMITQMRKLGVDTMTIGAFSAAFNLPWAFKFVAGPVVDLFYSNRLGRRRGWIVMAQIMMCLTLLMAIPIDCSKEITLLSLILILHNIFAATQDVAIDALACGTLKEDERGLGNGLMFAGAFAGNAVGGTCVLWLMALGVGFNLTFIWTIATIMVVTLLISMRIREPHHTLVSELPEGATRSEVAIAGVKTYVKTAVVAFFGTRQSLAGLGFVLLPVGSYSLCCAISTNLNVEMGMSDAVIGNLALIGSVFCAAGCVVGGLLADKFNRRVMLAIFCTATSIMTLLVAYLFWKANWIYPVAPGPEAVKPSQFLYWGYIVIGTVFGFFHGLTYGTKSAIMMDVCNPAVAATQFTAYMALSNLVNAYTNIWQCGLVAKLGYPVIFMLDAIVGVLCIFFLPFMGGRQKPAADVIAVGPEEMLEVAKV
jgi:MFS transporter, PAT family, beta-lactamase induction signal transducer AmpG